VENVAYISGRKDVLCTLFYFLAFLFFVRYRKRGGIGSLLLIFPFYLLALGSKEMAVTLPAVFFLYDTVAHLGEQGRYTPPLFRNVVRALREALRQYPLFYTFLLSVSLAFLIYWIFFLGGSRGMQYHGESVYTNFITVPRVVFHYVKLLLFPVRLSADYSRAAFPLSESIWEGPVLLSLIALSCVVFLLWRSLARHKWIAFGGFWFFITLLPVCQIVPHHELMAERFLYLPSFGFCLIAGLLLERTFLSKRTSHLAAGAFLVVLLVFSWRAAERNKDWKNELTLWEETVRAVPSCARALSNLGGAYHRLGRDDEATLLVKKALEIRPGYALAYNNLGTILASQHAYEDAIKAYETAVEMDSSHPDIWNNLGTVLLSLGRIEEAQRCFWSAQEAKPGLPQTQYNIGTSYLRDGHVDWAIEWLKLVARPSLSWPEAHYNLGIAYLKKGSFEEAAHCFREALRLRPGFAEAHNNLGEAYVKKGDYEQARRQFRLALALNQDLAEAHEGLGRVFLGMGLADEAREAFEKALHLKPDMEEAQEGLAQTVKVKDS
jgi:tetratricopeptide (TPR) repeat protein